MFKPVEMYVGESGTAPFLITCEHASNALPPECSWPEEDLWLCDTHWAWDPGVARLSKALADETEAVAVLGAFSRLYIDPNRCCDDPRAFRGEADGRPVHFNQDLDEAERARRIARCYTPFHEALARQARNRRGNFMLSIHSFTPLYQGEPRAMEVAVMHVDQDAMAQRWCEIFQAGGFATVINEPYSGADGYMYCVERHARASGRTAMMFEFRQDLIDARSDDMVKLMEDCLRDSGVLL